MLIKLYMALGFLGAVIVILGYLRWKWRRDAMRDCENEELNTSVEYYQERQEKADNFNQKVNKMATYNKEELVKQNIEILESIKKEIES